MTAATSATPETEMLHFVRISERGIYRAASYRRLGSLPNRGYLAAFFREAPSLESPLANVGRALRSTRVRDDLKLIGEKQPPARVHDIERMFIEPGLEDNHAEDPFEVSDADTVLAYLEGRN